MTNISKDYWDSLHNTYEREKIRYDNWLEPFNSVIDSCRTPIIDLGCGSGNDTKYLIEREKQVIPCDFSEQAIKNILKNFPEIQCAKCFDMNDGLPFEDNFTSIIIADLSLHYFSEKNTLKILEDIKRVLKKDGFLIFRVNSVNDFNHGAGQGEEIEKHFYKTTDGRFKRFFDEIDIDKFFKNWKQIYKNEEEMLRYDKPKQLWNCVYQVIK